MSLKFIAVVNAAPNSHGHRFRHCLCAHACRVQRKSKAEDMAANCFICNIDRAEFDRRGSGFAHHQVEDHDVWSYVWLVAHLRFRDATELNGTESYLAKKVRVWDCIGGGGGGAGTIGVCNLVGG